MKTIVAVDEKWGIGKDNDLLFRLPKDLKYFKEKTLGKVIVMGHNTLLSFPNSEPLKERKNVVVSQIFKSNDKYEVAYDLDELFSILKKYDTNDIFVVGGTMLYATLLEYSDEAYITKVKSDGNATHFFPNLDSLPNWKLTEEGEAVEDNGYTVFFTKYINLTPKTY